jgi:hypothetical protein
VACFGPLSHYLEKVSHRFRYKIQRPNCKSGALPTELYPPEPSGACMKESDASSILLLGATGPSWSWTRDLAREVNHHTYGPTNWERINRFFFGRDSSFPNAAYNSPVYCALQVCLFPSFLTMANLCEITLMRRKKKALRGPSWPNPRHSKILFQIKPAPISSQEIDK